MDNFIYYLTGLSIIFTIVALVVYIVDKITKDDD